jgi:hypothetical protein
MMSLMLGNVRFKEAEEGFGAGAVVSALCVSNTLTGLCGLRGFIRGQLGGHVCGKGGRFGSSRCGEVLYCANMSILGLGYWSDIIL